MKSKLFAGQRPRVSRLRGSGLALACLGLLAFTSPLLGASFTAIPTAKVGASYESNPRLQDNDEDDAAGLILEGILNMEWASERTSLAVKPRGRFSFYADSDDNDLEDEDLYLDGRLSHTTVLSEYALEAGYSTVGVRSSEVESAGGDSGSGSGTVRRADDSRQTFRIAPEWSRLFGTRNRIIASAGYTDVDFDKETSGTGRLPYEYWNGDLTFQRTLNEKTSAGLRVDATRFESNASGASIDNETNSYGASLFTNYAFTETLSGSVYGGWQTSDIELTRQPFTFIGTTPVCVNSAGQLSLSCTEKFSDDNFVGQASLRKESEITDYTLSVSRSITPNSNGAETIRDTLDAVVSRQLTPRLRGRIGVLYFNREDVSDITNRDSDYISARFSLNWRLTERWSLDSFYRYVNDQDELLNGNTDDATNHYLYFGVRYQGRGWRR